MVGRDDALAHVERALASTQVRGVVLAGPEGIGKTRLAREVADRAGPDTVVRWVSATPATSDLPFGAFAPFLPAEAATFGLPALLLVRHGLVGDGGQRLLLVVDDAQLLDEGSAGLVHQLASAGDARLVLTQRTGEPAPETITRLWRDHLVERIDLEPLDHAAVADLAAAVLGDPVDAASARLLLERSGGNPLFARELVIAGAAGDEWQPTPAGRRWSPGEASSPRLADLLADRLAALGPAHQDALLHLAFGEPLALTELQSLASDDVIEDLEAAGLVVAEEVRRRMVVRFAHPGHVDVVRRGAGPIRARRVRTDLVEVLLAAEPRRPQDDLRLATIALEAGIDLPPEVLARAGRAALFAGDYPLSIDLCRRSFAERPDFEVGRVLADALYADGVFPTIEAHWREWEPLATTDEQRAVVGLLKAVSHYYRAADAATAFAVLDDLVAQLPGGPGRDEALGLRATLEMMSGRHTEALGLALPLVEDRGPDRVLVQATLAATSSLRCAGRFTEALAVADRALAAYEVFGPQVTLVSSSVIGMVQCSVHVDAGSMEVALAYGDATRDAALLSGDPSAHGLAELVRSDALTVMGRLTDALAAARAAESTFVDLRHTAFLRWAVIQRGLVAVEAHDTAGVDAAIADLDALGRHPAELFEYSEVVLRSWQAHLRGDTAVARAMLLDTAPRLLEMGNPNGAARCWYEVIRLGGRGVGGAMEQAVATFDGQRFPVMAAHASALDRGDAAGVSAAAERFGAMGALPSAVVAATHAAELHLDAKDARAATRWSQQATEWAAMCQEVPSPDLAVAIAPIPLTRREREVAQLAANGMSAREIAERLYLSHRTVENHLARSYDKLGVRSRAELTALLAAG